MTNSLLLMRLVSSSKAVSGSEMCTKEQSQAAGVKSKSA